VRFGNLHSQYDELLNYSYSLEKSKRALEEKVADLQGKIRNREAAKSSKAGYKLWQLILVAVLSFAASHLVSGSAF